MGYLGLDATGEVKQDNMLQRVFWPVGTVMILVSGGHIRAAG